MKLTTTTIALFITILLFAATSHLPSATANFVIDSDGRPLENGGSYYILSARWGASGGGLSVAKTGNETCPVSVIQAGLSEALPVKISTPFRIQHISENIILSMAFTSVPDCGNAPSQWSVVDTENGQIVKLSGAYEDSVYGWFIIKSGGYGFRHEIKFCNAYDDRDEHNRCTPIEVRSDKDGVRHLVVSEKSTPFPVLFKKVPRHHIDFHYRHHLHASGAI